MFSDLQTMVHAQGTLIDSVEQNVRDARGYLEKSEGELENARRINKRKQWVGLLHSAHLHCSVGHHRYPLRCTVCSLRDRQLIINSFLAQALIHLQ